jgi:hypothetical protein
MAQSILIFDFGTNEEAAQKARHKVEAWTQGARLGKKILLKFEREQDAAEQASETGGEVPAAPAEPKSKKAGKSAAKRPTAVPESEDSDSEKNNSDRRVRLLVRLDFSDHEKLTRQRWMDRIAAEEPFKSTASETHRTGESGFAKTAQLFDSLG